MHQTIQDKQGLLNLPFDIFLGIVPLLEIEDIFALKKTCQTLHRLCDTVEVWVNIAQKLYDQGVALPVTKFRTDSEELASSARRALRLEHKWSQATARAERTTTIPASWNSGANFWTFSISSNLIACLSFGGSLNIWLVNLGTCIHSQELCPGLSPFLFWWGEFVLFDAGTCSWHLVYRVLDDPLGLSSTTKILTLRFEEIGDDETAYDVKSSICTLVIHPTLLNPLNVRVLYIGGRTLFLYFNGGEGDQNILLYFQDWQEETELAIRTGISPGPDHSICAISWDSREERIIIDIQCYESYGIDDSKPPFRHSYPLSYLVSHAASIGKRFAAVLDLPLLRPTESIEHNHYTDRPSGFPFPFIVGLPSSCDRRQWLSIPNFATRSFSASVTRIVNRPLTARDEECIHYFKYTYRGFLHSGLRTLHMRSRTFAANYPGTPLQTMDGSTVAWLDQAEDDGTGPDTSSIALIRFPRPKAEGYGRVEETERPNICAVGCDAGLANHDIGNIRIDAAFGRLLLILTTGEVVILHFI